MSMTHVLEIGAENAKIERVLFVTRNWYPKNSVPNRMSDVPETGIGF